MVRMMQREIDALGETLGQMIRDNIQSAVADCLEGALDELDWDEILWDTEKPCDLKNKVEEAFDRFDLDAWLRRQHIESFECVEILVRAERENIMGQIKLLEGRLDQTIRQLRSENVELCKRINESREWAQDNRTVLNDVVKDVYGPKWWQLARRFRAWQQRAREKIGYAEQREDGDDGR